MRSPLNIAISHLGVPRWVSDKTWQSRSQMRTIYRPAFAANIVIDFSLGDVAMIVATSNIAFNINAPLNDPGDEGTEFGVIIVNNTAGALGAVTWNATYLTAAGITYPATLKSRTYDFYKVRGLTGAAGGSWLMDSSTADTPVPA